MLATKKPPLQMGFHSDAMCPQVLSDSKVQFSITAIIKPAAPENAPAIILSGIGGQDCTKRRKVVRAVSGWRGEKNCERRLPTPARRNCISHGFEPFPRVTALNRVDCALSHPILNSDLINGLACMELVSDVQYLGWRQSRFVVARSARKQTSLFCFARIVSMGAELKMLYRNAIGHIANVKYMKARWNRAVHFFPQQARGDVRATGPSNLGMPINSIAPTSPQTASAGCNRTMSLDSADSATVFRVACARRIWRPTSLANFGPPRFYPTHRPLDVSIRGVGQ